MNTQAQTTETMPTLNEIGVKLKDKSVVDMLAMSWVHDRFIKNYNRINKSDDGALALQRQLLIYKKLLSENEQLMKATTQSHYKCFIEASIKGWSLDPADNQVYVLSYVTKSGNNAVLQPQAGAYVARLMNTAQIEYVSPVEIVYNGDDFKFSNGKVEIHNRNLSSNEIKAAYVKVVIAGSSVKNPKEVYFLYTPNDWSAWRKKSKIPDSDNWIGGPNKQPIEAFLKTKVVLHACKEKCWGAGETPLGVEHYPDAITEEESADNKTIYADNKEDAQNNTNNIEDAVMIDEETGEENVSSTGEKIEW